MRIAMVGSGSMGSAFGGKLTEAGNEVWLIDVWKEHVDKMTRKGLHIEGVGGDRVVKVRATTDHSQPGPVELVIVFTKSADTKTAALQSLPLKAENTLYLTIQNGLGNREIIASVVGNNRVLSGVTFDSANLLETGHVKHTSTGRTVIGEIDGTISQRAEKIAEVFRKAGFDMQVSTNALSEVWGKLLVNCVTSPIAVLTQETIGGLIDYPSGREWMRLVGEEVASVAQALSIRLPYENVMDKLLKNSQAAGAAKPSMRQDVEKGRWTEIDFINGAVVREGKRVGVPTPHNLALTLMIRMIDARAHREEKIFA